MYGGRNSGYLSRYKQFLGIALTYKANGFDLGVAHNRGDDLNGNKSLTTSTLGGSYAFGDAKVFAGYHDQVNRNSVLLADYVAVFNSQVAPALGAAGLPPASVAGLQNVFLTNITRNSQIDAVSYQFGMHYRFGAARVMASVARQNDRSASWSRLQPVQANRRVCGAIEHPEPKRWAVHARDGECAWWFYAHARGG